MRSKKCGIFSKNVVCAVQMWYVQYKCGTCSKNVVCAVKIVVCAVKMWYVH